MRKWLVIVLLVLGLSGCSSEEVMETVADEWMLPVMAQPRQIVVNLPGEVAMPVSETDSGRLYLCQDYEIALQTLSSGDLNGTLQSVTGYGKEDLTILETLRSDLPCYEFTWTCAGENGDRIGQGILMDDGHYHYVMTALWDADKTESMQLSWSEVFSSFDVA